MAPVFYETSCRTLTRSLARPGRKVRHTHALAHETKSGCVWFRLDRHAGLHLPAGKPPSRRLRPASVPASRRFDSRASVPGSPPMHAGRRKFGRECRGAVSLPTAFPTQVLVANRKPSRNVLSFSRWPRVPGRTAAMAGRVHELLDFVGGRLKSRGQHDADNRQSRTRNQRIPPDVAR